MSNNPLANKNGKKRTGDVNMGLYCNWCTAWSERGSLRCQWCHAALFEETEGK